MIFSAAALLFAVVPIVGLPDTWRPYRDGAHYAPDGRHYVVTVSKTGFDDLHYWICEVADLEAPRLGAGAREPRGSDRVVGEGDLDQCPLELSVANSGEFVAFEKHGAVGHGQSLIHVRSDGEVGVTKTLKELFDGQLPGKVLRSSDAIRWHRGWWFDPTRRTAVVAAFGDVVREVSLVDGVVRNVDVDGLLSGIVHGGEGRLQAIEIAARRLDGVDLERARYLAQPLTAPQTPAGSRVHVALLHAASDPERALEIILAPWTTEEERSSRRWRSNARIAASELLDSFAFLAGDHDALPRDGVTAWRSSYADQWTRFGWPGIAVLCELQGAKTWELRPSDRSGWRPRFDTWPMNPAMHQAFFDGLVEFAKRERTSPLCVIAVGSILTVRDRYEVHPVVIDLLSEPTICDAGLVEFLYEHPVAEAVPVLSRVRARGTVDEDLLAEALRCSGEAVDAGGGR